MKKQREKSKQRIQNRARKVLGVVLVGALSLPVLSWPGAEMHLPGAFSLNPAIAQGAETSEQTLLSNPIGFEGGIRNELKYQEVIFVTGEPIVVTGELKFTQGRARNGISSQKYTYKLENVEKGVTLSRSINLEITQEEGTQQTYSVAELKSFNETITVGSGRGNQVSYRLADEGYQFHQAIVMDHQPVVDYFSGNWNGRKTYQINRNEGTVTLDIQGTAVGYDENWGSTESRQVDYFIDYQRLVPAGAGEEAEDELVTWNGTARLQVSFNRTKDLQYIVNEPVPISFRGGYLQTVQEENILQYEYNLPYFHEEAGMLEEWRNQGTQSLKLNTVPRQERLPVFTMTDIRGHWAEEPISRLISIGCFSETAANFGPSLPMTRADFARAMAEIGNLEAPVNNESLSRSRKKAEPVVSPFVDVPATHADFQYILTVADKGLFSGVGQGRFNPAGTLTRAEAVTAIIRALGFQGLAPNPNYQLSVFLDDTQIPDWARDSVYVANQLNLVTGSFGYFSPQEPLTRAEAAVLMDRFREYLQQDLKSNYRDRLLNRG